MNKDAQIHERLDPDLLNTYHEIMATPLEDPMLQKFDLILKLAIIQELRENYRTHMDLNPEKR